MKNGSRSVDSCGTIQQQVMGMGIEENINICYEKRTGRNHLCIALQFFLGVLAFFFFLLVQFFGQYTIAITMQAGPESVLALVFCNISLVDIKIKKGKALAKGLCCKNH